MAPRAPPTTIFCGWLTSHGKIAGVRYFENTLLALPCRIASCKKRTQPQLSLRLRFFEIRQLAILPDLGWSSTFAVDELNFCVRNGNRWILVAIITGMAPLVGLEATKKFQKCLILAYFCPILPHFQRKIKPCAKRVPKHTTSDSDLKTAADKLRRL